MKASSNCRVAHRPILISYESIFQVNYYTVSQFCIIMMGNAHTSSSEGHTLERSKAGCQFKKSNPCDESTKSSIGKGGSGGLFGKGEPDSKQLLKMFKSEDISHKKEYGKFLEKIRDFDPKVQTTSTGSQKRDN